MNNKFAKFFVFLCAMFCISISVQAEKKSIVVDKTIELRNIESSNDIPNMCYIGFKYTEKNAQWDYLVKNSTLQNFGSLIQLGGYAIDESYTFFGMYTLQELAVYKSAKRYVTFVEFQQLRIYERKADYKTPTGCCGDPTNQDPKIEDQKTLTGLETTFNVYVYDTQEKKIKYKDTEYVKVDDVWQGWLIGDNEVAARDKIYNNYANYLSNAIFNKYDKVKLYLKQNP